MRHVTCPVHPHPKKTAVLCRKQTHEVQRWRRWSEGNGQQANDQVVKMRLAQLVGEDAEIARYLGSLFQPNLISLPIVDFHGQRPRVSLPCFSPRSSRVFSGDIRGPMNTPGDSASPAVLAQGYPTKPVRLIEPFGLGGGRDLLARALAQKLSEWWNQPVTVENITGAGATAGPAQVA